MRVVDLFAGPGGWDVAARDLGVDPLGIEMDAATCETRRAAGLRTLEGDVATLDPEDFAPVEGLVASPPCQGFSVGGGQRGRLDLHRPMGGFGGRDSIHECAAALGRGLDLRKHYAKALADVRSTLVVEPLRWALALRPRWIALEQVPPVLGFWETCAAVLADHGYSTWTGLLYAETFGVPQTRKRAFLIASCDGPVEPPAPTHSRYHSYHPDRLDEGVLPWVSQADALGWPQDALVGFPRRNDRSTPGEYRARDFRRASAPAFALTSRASSWVRRTSDGDRELSLGEAAVLQSFPADHPFHGRSRSGPFQQLANAVPPLMGRHVLQAAMAPSTRGEAVVA